MAATELNNRPAVRKREAQELSDRVAAAGFGDPGRGRRAGEGSQRDNPVPWLTACPAPASATTSSGGQGPTLGEGWGEGVQAGEDLPDNHELRQENHPMMLQRRNHFSPFGELRQMQDNMDRMWRRFGSFQRR